MRPYFFNRNRGYQAAEMRRVAAYRTAQRETDRAAKKKANPFTMLKSVVRFLTGHALDPWERKAIQAAKEKRIRRRARNILWWSNDKTWDFSPYMSDAEVME